MFGSTGADCIVIGSSGAISSKLYSTGVSNLLDFLFLGKESLDLIGLPRFRRGLDVLAIAFPESISYRDLNMCWCMNSWNM